MGFNESSIFDLLYSRGDYMPSSVRIQPAVQRRRLRGIKVRGDSAGRSMGVWRGHPFAVLTAGYARRGLPLPLVEREAPATAAETPALCPGSGEFGALHS
jgi:hypothetical protein